MRDQAIAGFLRQLAARVPAPGGGAAAALQAAQAAALIAMAARYSDGPRDDAGVSTRVAGAADRLAGEALGLAEADAAAFGKVSAAYGLGRDTPGDKQARSRAISDALAGAARPPADLIAVSGRLAGLAEELLPTVNPNVIGDLAAAAAALRSAVVTAQVNIEANLTGVRDQAAAAELAALAAAGDGITERADRLIAAVRAEVKGRVSRPG